MDELKLKKITSLISSVAKEFGEDDAFYVGGFPRSVVMRKPASDIHDLDIATASMGKATQFAGLLASESDASRQEILHRTMSIRLEIDGVELDFQGPMPKDEVLPYVRKAGIPPTPLAINIYGRDFTMNALAIPVLRPGIVLDLTKRGVRDITNKVVASILPPNEAVPENPLIITRAVRFSQKYGFEIDRDLWQAMKDNSDVLRRKMSPERLAVEAFALAKYQPEEKLKALGLEDLASPEMVMAGKKVAEE